MCVCSLSMKTWCNPFTPAGPRGIPPSPPYQSDQMVLHSSHLPDRMTLNRLPWTREHTGRKISEPFLDFQPLISDCLQIARARGMTRGAWNSRHTCGWHGGQGVRLLWFRPRETGCFQGQREFVNDWLHSTDEKIEVLSSPSGAPYFLLIFGCTAQLVGP